MTTAWPLLALALALTAGCRREEVTHYTVDKGAEAEPARMPPMAQAAPRPGPAAGDSPMAAPAAAPAAQQAQPAQPRGGMPGMAGEIDAPPPPARALQWTLPKGWTATMVGGMRYATLTPPGSGHLDVSVVQLPGPAGGELANVNRWRGQLGLAAVDAGALASTRQEVKAPAGTLSVYDFTGEGQKKSRMIAGMTVANGSSWFVKMVGDEKAVAAARPDFLHLLQSLHFDAN